MFYNDLRSGKRIQVNVQRDLKLVTVSCITVLFSDITLTVVGSKTGQRVWVTSSISSTRFPSSTSLPPRRQNNIGVRPFVLNPSPFLPVVPHNWNLLVLQPVVPHPLVYSSDRRVTDLHHKTFQSRVNMIDPPTYRSKDFFFDSILFTYKEFEVLGLPDKDTNKFYRYL